ncbi:Hypothetical predicted protein [Mytilus galloprovincialis]|uniref:Tesmin/TSO1-like CXC domain-containing protein n=1 Tax=Mytilus galloprovincialis TaxID=29158 RepID=A0A8B6GVW6_MYTGA|nr:Hypothetical predicted protein [Mytilus galloprovincialis]
MVNRVDTDFMRCAHSQLHGHKKSIDELHAVNKALQIKLDDFLESLQAETGLCSSYRLVASVYFANHRPAFRSSASISELYNTIELGDGLESHTALVKIILSDSDVNIDKVEKTIKWYTKGCSCKSSCTTNRCRCKKTGFSVGGYCGPGCKCQNCKNIASCRNELPELDACSVIDSDEGEDEVQIAPSHPSQEFQQYWDTFGILTGGLVPDL